MKVVCIQCGAKFVLPDEAVVAGGVPVQCSRCETTFTAYHPGDAAAPGASAPGPAPIHEPMPEPEPPSPEDVVAITEVATPRRPAPEEPLVHPLGVEPPVVEPEPLVPAFPEPEVVEPPVVEPPVVEPPVVEPSRPVDYGGYDDDLDDDLYPDDDDFLAARRRKRKVRNAVLVLLGLGVGVPAVLYFVAPGTFDALVGRHIGLRAAWDKEAVRLRSEAWPLLLRDDPESLKKAAEHLEKAHELDPDYPEVAADLGAARALMASHIRARGRRVLDEGEALNRKAAGVNERLRKAQKRGARGRGEAARLRREVEGIIEELKALDATSTTIFEEGGRWAGQGATVLRQTYDANKEHPYAMAGLAVYFALEDERSLAETLLKNMRTLGETPALGLLAEGLLNLQGEKSPEKRKTALDAFEAALAAEPGMIRALHGKARALEELGRPEEAAAARAALAEANPEHPAAAGS